MPALRCITDRYDNTGSIYADIEDFLLMCDACFDTRPAMVLRADGWHDVDGLVLVEVQS